MGSELSLLNAALVFAAFAGIFWWIYSKSTRSPVQRKQKLGARKIAHQPWSDDKAGGRGNR